MGNYTLHLNHLLVNVLISENGQLKERGITTNARAHDSLNCFWLSLILKIIRTRMNFWKCKSNEITIECWRSTYMIFINGQVIYPHQQKWILVWSCDRISLSTIVEKVLSMGRGSKNLYSFSPCINDSRWEWIVVKVE